MHHNILQIFGPCMPVLSAPITYSSICFCQALLLCSRSIFPQDPSLDSSQNGVLAKTVALYTSCSLQETMISIPNWTILDLTKFFPLNHANKCAPLLTF